MAWNVGFAAVIAAVTSRVAVANPARPACQISEALVGSVDSHLEDWDRQVDVALNETFNCSTFLEWTYDSRDLIRIEMDYIRGNFTQTDEEARAQGGEGIPTSAAMSYVSRASSLLSAHLHIHGQLVVARRGCLSEHLQLLFLMSLRRMHTLLHQQLRQLWVVFQGTAELMRHGSAKWISEVVELCEADLHTMESVMVSWRPPPSEMVVPEGEELPTVPPRPGPPLPQHTVREPDGIALSTVEVLRRETFDEWESPKPVYRALLRYVLPRDGHVADFCGGGGFFASFLNDTGLLTAYAFDASPNIRLLTRGSVEHLAFGLEEVKLWRGFDMVVCLSAADNFASDPDAWGKAWRTIEGHASRAAILNCGVGDVRKQALVAAASFAPGLAIDQLLSDQLSTASPGVCVFWRGAPPESLQ